MRRKKKTHESMFEINGKMSSYSCQEGLERLPESGGAPFGIVCVCV